MMTTKRINHIELSHILTAFVLFSVCTKQLTAAGPGRCIDDEKLALLDFKSGLVDDYDRLSTWNDTIEEDCCRWTGVSCSNRTGNVVWLDLRGRYGAYAPLKGTVNPSLLRLPYLNHLDLSANNFGPMPIPEFIGSLANLTYLNLSTSYFAGTVPSQLGNLSQLRYLSLSFSASDAGNLEWLSGLTLLEHLDMEGVDLSKATDWAGVVSRLPSLSYLSLSGCLLNDPVFPSSEHPLLTNSSTSIRTLDLSYNNLTSSVFRWLYTNVSQNLVFLSLSYNQLGGQVPEAFRNVTSLEYLLLSNNGLEGMIPESFGDLASLSQLDLSNNTLQGHIPKSLGNLCNLKNLYLANNRLSGNLGDFLDELSTCPRGTLEVFDVGFNNLIGAVPDTIGRFSPLKKLVLCSNHLNGSLPGSLGTLTKLEYLDISYNSLQGVVSEVHLLNVSRLTYLKMAENRLALKFDPRWVPPFQLEFIYLSSCDLGPRFPRWIQTENLNILNISNARIKDTIPARFWDGLNSTTLRSLNLSYNQIKGTVPDLSSRVSDFAIIDLRSNLFEGPVPPFPLTLLSLNLSSNKFSGHISFLCQIVDGLLNFLDLSHNLLTGDLPDCLSLFPELVVVNVAYNKLTGKVPGSIGSLVKLEVLNLYNNWFYGELPVAMRNCTMLNSLNLGSNKLSGVVPEWIGANLFKLKVLSLRSNNFSGTIPSRICQLTDLRVIDLSMNRLSGKIPKCLNNLTSMVQNEQHSAQLINYPYISTSTAVGYVDYAIVGWKGRQVEFQKNLGLLKSIDLSSNNLTGEIPNAITDLLGMMTLNLSRNRLHGRIPQGIGQLRSAQVLDFSKNRLSGEIPGNLSDLSFLGYLDLSDNNFSGKIPSGTQLQSFDASKYSGNFGLCGPPLTKLCPGDHIPTNTIGGNQHSTDRKVEDVFWGLFGSGALSGFVAGFCGACSALLLNCRWGDATFMFLSRLKDLIIVKTALWISKVKEFISMKV